MERQLLDDKKRVLTDEEWDRFTTGLNKLGKILMAERARLQAATPAVTDEG